MPSLLSMEHPVGITAAHVHTHHMLLVHFFLFLLRTGWLVACFGITFGGTGQVDAYFLCFGLYVYLYECIFCVCLRVRVLT